MLLCAKYFVGRDDMITLYHSIASISMAISIFIRFLWIKLLIVKLRWTCMEGLPDNTPGHYPSGQSPPGHFAPGHKPSGILPNRTFHARAQRIRMQINTIDSITTIRSTRMIVVLALTYSTRTVTKTGNKSSMIPPTAVEIITKYISFQIVLLLLIYMYILLIFQHLFNISIFLDSRIYFDWISIMAWSTNSVMILMALPHKSYNAPVQYPTMHHFVKELWSHVHVSFKNGVLWDICVMHYGM